MDTKRRKPEEVVAKLRHRSPRRSARSCRQSPNRPVAGAQSVSQRLVPSLAVARELASVVRADYVAPLPGAVRFNPRLALGRLSSHAPFEADRDELLRFDSEFHRRDISLLQLKQRMLSPAALRMKETLIESVGRLQANYADATSPDRCIAARRPTACEFSTSTVTRSLKAFTRAFAPERSPV